MEDISSEAEKAANEAEVIAECLVEEDRQQTQAFSAVDEEKFFRENPNFVSEIAARRAKGMYLPDDEARIAVYYKRCMTNLEQKLQMKFIGKKGRIPLGSLAETTPARPPPPTSQARRGRTTSQWVPKVPIPHVSPTNSSHSRSTQEAHHSSFSAENDQEYQLAEAMATKDPTLEPVATPVIPRNLAPELSSPGNSVCS